MLIRAITTNNGKTLDRYSIYFWNGDVLTMSHNPDSPQGVSMWGQTYGINDSHFEEAAYSEDHVIPGTDEKMINWFELPPIVQAHVEQQVREAGE